jgi:hypothetical protein
MPSAFTTRPARQPDLACSIISRVEGEILHRVSRGSRMTAGRSIQIQVYDGRKADMRMRPKVHRQPGTRSVPSGRG